MKKTFVFLLMLLVGSITFAQSRREVVRERVDSVLRKNYEKGSYDTLYIKRPDSKLTLKMRGNLSGNYIHAKNTMDGYLFRTKLNTDTRATLSAAATYYGVTAGVALNPARLAGKNKDVEFNLNAYGNRFGLEANYQESKTLSGDIDYDDGSYHLAKGDLKMTLVTVTGYYAFNYRHFSYPAAFTQSYIQKRSAGSWLVGFTFQGGRIKSTDDAPAEMADTRMTMRSFAVGGGYGYNLVAGKWLFHASTQPCLIVFNDNDIKINGEKQDEDTHFPEMIINSRAAIVYNISKKYFAGSTFLFNTTLFGNFDEYTRQTKWRARVFVGIRL
jgi:hypothetical protein